MEVSIATTMLLQTIMLMHTSVCSQFPIRLVVSDQMGVARMGEMVCSGAPFAEMKDEACQADEKRVE